MFAKGTPSPRGVVPLSRCLEFEESIPSSRSYYHLETPPTIFDYYQQFYIRSYFGVLVRAPSMAKVKESLQRRVLYHLKVVFSYLLA